MSRSIQERARHNDTAAEGQHVNSMRYEFGVLTSYGVLPAQGDLAMKLCQSGKQRCTDAVPCLLFRNKTVSHEGREDQSTRETLSKATATFDVRIAQFENSVLEAYGLVFHWKTLPYLKMNDFFCYNKILLYIRWITEIKSNRTNEQSKNEKQQCCDDLSSMWKTGKVWNGDCCLLSQDKKNEIT